MHDRERDAGMKLSSRQKTTPLRKIVEIIRTSADPEKIILFGSRAKGTRNRRSDYDIWVLKRGMNRRRELTMKLYRDLYGVCVPVDVIVETPETFEELKREPVPHLPRHRTTGENYL